MPTPVLLPKLSTGADEVVLVHWLRNVGDAVAADEPLAEVETDKAVVELTAPAAGFLRRHLVQPGSTVSVGEPVAIITATADEPLEEKTSTPAAADDGRVAPRAPRNRISPVAKKRARELGLETDGLPGSGPGGRILLRDVEDAARKRAVAADVAALSGVAADRGPARSGRRVPLDRIRTIVASRMTLSAQTVPQFTVGREADVTDVLALRRSINRHLHRERTLSFIDFVSQAVARVLQAHPYLNASFEGTPGQADAAIILHDSVNIGLATATPSGLLVPVIHSAERMTLLELAAARRAAVARALDGRLSRDDLGSGTFTISNLGPLGADNFTAMINPPEAAILAVGRAVQRPVVRDGEVAVRSMVSLNVTVDHRVADGAAATEFLLEVVRTLENSPNWNLA